MSRRSRHGRRPPTSASGPAAPRDDAEQTATATSDELAPAPAPAAAPPRAEVRAEARPDARPEAHAESRSESQAEPESRPEPRLEPASGDVPDGDAGRGPTCTQAQLRRFIKSRPWIPMHELRRRFGIMGGDDDVTPVKTPDGTIFVGLPPAEGRMLGELLVGGDVGYELSLDPGAPIVVGVYPMRPVARG